VWYIHHHKCTRPAASKTHYCSIQIRALVPKGKAYRIQDSTRITHIRRPLPLLYAVIVVVVSPGCSASPKEFLPAEEDLPAPATLLSPVLVSAAGNIPWAVSHSHLSSLFAFLFLLSSLKPFVYLFRRSIRLFHTSIGTYTLTIRTTRPCFLLPTKMLLRPFQRQNFIVKKHHRLDPNRTAPSDVR
jgi:hypothetical protein